MDVNKTVTSILSPCTLPISRNHSKGKTSFHAENRVAMKKSKFRKKERWVILAKEDSDPVGRFWYFMHFLLPLVWIGALFDLLLKKMY